MRALVSVILAASAALAAPGHDAVRHRIDVPSEARRQGEVRIVQRGSDTVVQTALESRVLRRVVGSIVEKENGNWPEGHPGHADSVRYIEALEVALQQIRAAPRKPGTDRQLMLLIEFAIVGAEGHVLVSGVRPDGELRDPTLRLELSRDYVEQNMRLIVADAFSVAPDEARSLLLGP